MEMCVFQCRFTSEWQKFPPNSLLCFGLLPAHEDTCWHSSWLLSCCAAVMTTSVLAAVRHSFIRICRLQKPVFFDSRASHAREVSGKVAGQRRGGQTVTRRGRWTHLCRHGERAHCWGCEWKHDCDSCAVGLSVTNRACPCRSHTNTKHTHSWGLFSLSYAPSDSDGSGPFPHNLSPSSSPPSLPSTTWSKLPL